MVVHIGSCAGHFIVMILNSWMRYQWYTYKYAYILLYRSVMEYLWPHNGRWELINCRHICQSYKIQVEEKATTPVGLTMCFLLMISSLVQILNMSCVIICNQPYFIYTSNNPNLIIDDFSKITSWWVRSAYNSKWHAPLWTSSGPSVVAIQLLPSQQDIHLFNSIYIYIYITF